MARAAALCLMAILLLAAGGSAAQDKARYCTTDETTRCVDGQEWRCVKVSTTEGCKPSCRASARKCSGDDRANAASDDKEP
jgi:hypothetical protein